MNLWRAVTAMNLMEFSPFGPIIENIVAKRPAGNAADKLVYKG